MLQNVNIRQMTQIFIKLSMSQCANAMSPSEEKWFIAILLPSPHPPLSAYQALPKVKGLASYLFIRAHFWPIFTQFTLDINRGCEAESKLTSYLSNLDKKGRDGYNLFLNWKTFCVFLTILLLFWDLLCITLVVFKKTVSQNPMIYYTAHRCSILREDSSDVDKLQMT